MMNRSSVMLNLLLVIPAAATADVAGADTIFYQDQTSGGIVSFPQFDPALGELHQVSLRVDAWASARGRVYSIGPPERPEVGGVSFYSANGFIRVDPLGFGAPLGGHLDLSPQSQTYWLQPYESRDMDGFSSGSLLHSTSEVRDFIGLGYAAFQSTMQLADFQFTPHSWWIEGFGYGGVGHLSADLTLTYHYTPAPVPEPGSLALLAIGTAGAALARRRRRCR